MLLNYLKIAFRNLWKNKSLSLINILGLSVSIAVCFLIALFIIHELSFDTFHNNPENLFRITIKGEIATQPIEYAVSMVPLPIVLEDEFPEVEAAASVFSHPSKQLVTYDDRSFYETNISGATKSFFKVFDYELIRGDKETVLEQPNSIVLSESLAHKYFENADPVGETISLNETTDHTVTGVFKDFPSNSHLHMNALTSVEYTDDIPEYWGSFSAHNYIRLKNGTDPDAFQKKIENLAMDKMGITLDQTGMEFLLFLEPIKDIHLRSNYAYNLGNDGNITYVYVFSIIAFFILIIAYINFINLTTAHYLIRAKEVGMRKVIGASRKNLITQFLLESVVITIIATMISLILVELLQPVFKQLSGLEIELHLLTQGSYIFIGILVLLFLAIVSGIYPAFHLSANDLIQTIKGKFVGKSKRSTLRNILVVFQFIISIALIASTGIIMKQLQHIQRKKLGFDKEHVLILPIRSNEAREQALVLKEDLKNTSGIVDVCVSSNYPGSGASQGHGFFPEGYTEGQPWLMKTFNIDEDFIETFKLHITQGRAFSSEYENESMNILVNETLVKNVGWDEPIGKTFHDPFITEGEEMIPITVVGVVEDFHVNPLHDKIEPMIMYYNPPNRNYISMRLEPGNIYHMINIIETKWKEINPTMPYDYFFLDAQFDRIHRTERNLARTFMYFTILAIVIACLGLFGLASYATERRIKEIGIRKVMGSSVGQVIFLLTKDFSKLVLIANIVAWPLAWYAMNKWLQTFAYRTNITIGVFLLSGLIALVIAFLTVSFKTIKAANSNPVKSLKYE